MENQGQPPFITNRDLLLPYIAPYFAYVFIASFFGRFWSQEICYAIKIIVVPLILAWAWRWYLPLAGPKNPFVSALVGIPVGLVGLVLWIGLLNPFVDPQGAGSWSATGFWLRMASAAFIVPVFEELFVRGYVFRVALQWDQSRTAGSANAMETAFDHRCINQLAPGTWRLPAVMISATAFALGHHPAEWLAAFVYGLLMAGVMIVRKDMVSCIFSHGVTNLSLAIYVKTTGHYGFW